MAGERHGNGMGTACYVWIGLKCDRSWLMAIWKRFRMQRSESTSVLLEAYISLLPRSEDSSSAFLDKGSVKLARRAHVSVHITVHMHSPFHRLRFGHCAWHIMPVKRGDGCIRIHLRLSWSHWSLSLINLQRKRR